MRKIACVLLLLCLYGQILFSQDSIPLLERISGFPNKFFSHINKKASQLEDKLVASTEKALKRLSKQELRLKRKLSKKDSLAAEQIFGNVQEKYSLLGKRLNQVAKPGAGEYIPYADSLRTSLQFLTQDFASTGKTLSDKFPAVNNSLQQVTDLQSKLKQADFIRNYLRDRRAQLKQQLDRFNLVKSFQKYNKQAYYYSQQVQEYKDILKDQGKLEQKAMGLLRKLSAFQKFMSKYSELALLFPEPTNYGSQVALQGLQTRLGVQQLIQQQLGQSTQGGPNIQALMQQNIQTAKSQFDQLKEKISNAGGANSDFDMPDFKPNSQKRKSFLKRLEFGGNLQSSKSNNYWPVTSDIGLTLGYKLSDKAVFGIGGSYKIGWGRDIRNIVITHEGVGIRSYLDVKLKGKFYISGGYEQNYRQRFENIQQLKIPQSWKQSALLGVSKKYQIGKKWKGDVKLLFDFLYRQQIPVTQPLLFRTGYNL